MMSSMMIIGFTIDFLAQHATIFLQWRPLLFLP